MQKRMQNNSFIKAVKLFLFTTLAAAAAALILLLLTALLLDKAGLSEKQTQLMIYVVYLISSLTAGFLAGKCKREKKFVWGAAAGAVWFLTVLVLSLLLQHFKIDTTALFPAVVCMLGGGMLGGMLA